MRWSGPCNVVGGRRNAGDDCTIASLGDVVARPLNLGREMPRVMPAAIGQPLDPKNQSFRAGLVVVGACLAIGLIAWLAYLLSVPNLAVLMKDNPTLSARVHLVPIEGGCWMLDTRYGSFLAPTLPRDFRTDGLIITAKFALATNQAHYCPRGRGIVEISSVVRTGT
jgi:hypothetical protein